MRKVKVHKETYIILRRIKVEDNVKVPDILAAAVENYEKARKRRLAKLAKKLLAVVKREDPPADPPADKQDPATDGEEAQPE